MRPVIDLKQEYVKTNEGFNSLTVKRSKNCLYIDGHSYVSDSGKRTPSPKKSKSPKTKKGYLSHYHRPSRSAVRETGSGTGSPSGPRRDFMSYYRRPTKSAVRETESAAETENSHFSPSKPHLYRKEFKRASKPPPLELPTIRELRTPTKKRKHEDPSPPKMPKRRRVD